MTTLAPSGQGLAEELSHLRAVEQVQQSLEFATVGCGGVELEGNPALIKSISESIQSSNALSFFSCSISFTICTLPFFSSSISFSSCFVLCSERSICISTTGSRRQLSIRNNERKRGSDEPDAPLLGEGENSAWEGDVVIGGEQSDQANNTANNGLEQSLAIKPSRHLKQPSPTPTSTSLVHMYFITP